ncbi:MAG: RNase H1/viroplasmin domain-containing protein [Cyclobacteriaceae bacterium]
MKKHKFLVTQIDTYVKEVELEVNTSEEGVKLLSDSLHGVDISLEEELLPVSRTHSIECLKPVEDSRKYYVVWVGRIPGVYGSWAECKAQTNGFKGANFKSFVGRDIAYAAYQAGPVCTPPPPPPIYATVEQPEREEETDDSIDDSESPF